MAARSGPTIDVQSVSTAAVAKPNFSNDLRARPGTKLVAYAAPEVVRWIEAQGDDLKQTLRRHAAAGLRFEARGNFTRAQFDVGAEQ